LEIAAGPFDPSGVGDASRLAWVEPGGEDQTLGRGRGCVVCPETPKPARASGFRVFWRRGRDSNPRSRFRGSAVFKTSHFPLA